MIRRQDLPNIGEIVPGEGGRLGAIMRGHIVDGLREPDYAIIVPDLPGNQMHWGVFTPEIKGAGSLTDGLRNTQAMLIANCPPALHIAELVTGEGHTDLYLPAQAEFCVLRINVPELFDKAWHWTSTQRNADAAYVQDFEAFFMDRYGKGGEFLVRAVRRIALS